MKVFPDFQEEAAGDKNDEFFSAETSQSEAWLDLNLE